MSWGGGELSTEANYESYFSKNAVTFYASTGDTAGTEFPSVERTVVAVDGTSIARNPSDFSFLGEAAWIDTGGGTSTYLSRPAYQNGHVGNTHRVVPDVAAVADPNTGVWVYYSGGWYTFGGTRWRPQFLRAS